VTAASNWEIRQLEHVAAAEVDFQVSSLGRLAGKVERILRDIDAGDPAAAVGQL